MIELNAVASEETKETAQEVKKRSSSARGRKEVGEQEQAAVPKTEPEQESQQAEKDQDDGATSDADDANGAGSEEMEFPDTLVSMKYSTDGVQAETQLSTQASVDSTFSVDSEPGKSLHTNIIM